VSNTCKNEIQSEMKLFTNELEKTMHKYTDNISKMFTHNTPPRQTTQEIDTTPHMMPPTYRQSMPSPNPKKTNAQDPAVFQYDDDKTSPKDVEDSKRQPTTSFLPTLFQKNNALSFMHNGYTWDLRDASFLKDTGTLMTVENDTDLVQFYKQIQAMAIMFNIFVQQFQNLQPWNRSINTIPSTCIFTTINSNDNTINAYRRMKSALYTKISKAKFNSPVHQAIVNYGITQQDGFEVLYDLMTHCHPRLLQSTNRFRQTNQRPTFDKSDSIYTYANKLQTYLDIESINNHEFSHDDILNIVVEQLQEDTRYEIAIAGIRSELMLRDTVQRQFGETPFPLSLQLRNLPSTIMSYYTEEDKKLLFPPPDSMATISKLQFHAESDEDAIINNIIRRNMVPQRESIDKTCSGCGQFGHDVYHQGCDFCAKFLLAKEFLQNNPTAKKGIISKHIKHQQARRSAKKQQSNDKYKSKPDSILKKQGRYNTRSRAKVNMIADILHTALNIESDEDETDYEDAQQEDMTENDSSDHEGVQE
jgi:hypothetical protein